MLLDALEKEDLDGLTLLDVGGGVGVIQNELLKMGVKTAIGVEAAEAYAQVAREEAKRQGHSERITYMYGDFVEIAEKIPEAEIVTLDSVLCCYVDMVSLVKSSAERATKYYGIIYPRDNLWGKAMVSRWNLRQWIAGRDYRDYSHATKDVDELIQRQGLKRHFYWISLGWQVLVYAR